ncbi:MAG: xylose isomerase [Sulfobacillus acidophilus]|uniref:Xylose isomerase n=1 Tax=Sulfobacillus acidophilus TaxID=53633 RepID=A0A2T2WJM6_9FIRM|nr:MAG: xylose isomerase [Sulfobacillus acidophilus]
MVMTKDATLLTPKPEDRFTFGLWTVGNRGRDPFGDAVRPTLSPANIVRKLSQLGAYGVTLHDNDLVPMDATLAQRDRIVAEFRTVLADYQMAVPMVTVNLFYDPVFKDGAFTSASSAVRQFAINKAKAAMDLGHALGANIFVLWGGREGVETEAAKDPRQALAWYREGINALTEYVVQQKYAMRIALEAKPNEPRGDLYLSTTGAMLAFIATLDHPELVGVNPEVAHAKMAGLNPVHEVAQALDQGKLFHIDLNDQRLARYDQDLRFGSDDIKGTFYLVKLLEESDYNGPRHFDAHAYRTEDVEGVWQFARGSMRSYLAYREAVKRFQQDNEIQAALHAIEQMNAQGPTLDSPEHIEWWRQRGYAYEALDQLVTELLLGMR